MFVFYDADTKEVWYVAHRATTSTTVQHEEIQWRTVKGLAVGDSERTMNALYPNARNEYEEEDWTYWILEDPPGRKLLASSTASGQVIQIMNSGRCGSLEYVALGDSYSAGEGADPFFPGSGRCHRSKKAYSTLVQPPGYPDSLFNLRDDDGWGITWNFPACSGAVMENIVASGEGQHGGEPQLRHGSVGNDVNLVTITIGGNDAAFADILSHCAKYTCLNKPYKDGLTLREWLPKRIEYMRGSDSDSVFDLKYNLTDTYQAVKDANRNATIVVLNYPFLFPDTEAERSCFMLSPYKAGESLFFRESQEDLHEVMGEVAAAVGVHYVDVTRHFTDHEICGVKKDWVNGPSVDRQCGVVAGAYRCWPKRADRSFHPTTRGQQAYAVVLNRWLESQGPGLPPNPTPEETP
ncbi:MAG: SGNH/GDSL hydrolase family protein [Actinomycetota bacterium]|nr:SGNH/GDSL hydrolase family protein [Actinomycetota bacterium]